MAKFSFNGMDSLIASTQEMSKLSADEKLSILRPAAELLKEKYTNVLSTIFNVRSGALSGSVYTKEYADDNPLIRVSLKGIHPGSGMGKRANGKHASAGRKNSTNAEIAYYLEFGTPRIPATHWMETANEESEADIADTMDSSFGSLLKQKGF